MSHEYRHIYKTRQFLQKMYNSRIYGSSDGIPDKNFKNWRWITFDGNNQVVDPYLMLPKLFEAMSNYERDEFTSESLKYCELDMLAMVMIYGALKSEL